MFGRFIAWWIRNAALVAPIASSISAIAALCTVYLTTQNYRQSRIDNRDELTAKRPKFKLVEGSVTFSPLRKLDRSIITCYRPQFSLMNINPNPATEVKFRCQIYLDESAEVISKFVRRPSDDVDQGESVSIKINFLELEPVDTPYFLQIDAEYTDARTSEKYSQPIYRKFYIDEGQNADLEKLDMAELEDLRAQRSLVDNTSLQIS